TLLAGEGHGSGISLGQLFTHRCCLERKSHRTPRPKVICIGLPCPQSSQAFPFGGKSVAKNIQQRTTAGRRRWKNEDKLRLKDEEDVNAIENGRQSSERVVHISPGRFR